MLFGNGGNIEQELKDSIKASIKDRLEKACNTWDPAGVLAHAWGVKEMIDTSKLEEVKEYIVSIVGSKITLDSGQEVTILKGDVKEKNDEGILLYRYQLV